MAKLFAIIMGSRIAKALIVALGDYLVERTDNELDNDLWEPVKEVLKK